MASITGDDAANRLTGTELADTISALSGDDTLFGRAGDDDLFGDAGRDVLRGAAGDDELFGGEGSDTLDGGEGLDQLFGSEGADLLFGRAGADILSGTLTTGDNDFAGDRLFGGEGDDQLLGVDPSSDEMRGEGGDDLLQVDNDDAYGGDGDDLLATNLTGGRLSGEAGADRFLLRTFDDVEQRTVITDFRSEDTLSVRYTSAEAQVRLEGADLFGRLDTDGSGTLTADDGFSDQPEGLFIGVAENDSTLSIFLNEDTINLLGVQSVAAADWV